jgi:hypothetical protein
MATGSGKTTVMGMLAAWSILNKANDRSDGRFSDVVLVVCPNVTIRRRLRELDPKEDEASLYRTRDLVPHHLMPTKRRKMRRTFSRKPQYGLRVWTASTNFVASTSASIYRQRPISWAGWAGRRTSLSPGW